MKKVLGIVCGKRNGETERAARVALLAAKEKGCEVELINIGELNIKPCTGCGVCSRRLREPLNLTPCPQHDDDMEWLDEQICSSDALLFGAPMYEQAPPGQYKIMCDRFGPSHDVTIVKHIYDARVEAGIDPVYDPRYFIHRPAAFFGVGGSEWSHMGFPSLGIPAIPLGLKIVDREQFEWNRGILCYEDKIQRLRQMGEHLAAMAQLPFEEQWYNGPDSICPVCHNNVMRLKPGTNECTCVLCGMIGTVDVVDGKAVARFSEEALVTPHILASGREIHRLDMLGIGKPMPGQPDHYPTPEEREVGNAMAVQLMKELPTTRPPKK